MRERSSERAALTATICAFALAGGIILFGALASGGLLRDATDWARRGENGVLVDAAGVGVGFIVGLASLVVTVVLLALTRRSVSDSAQSATRSIEVADAALAEAREQRRKDLVPVVVVSSYSGRSTPHHFGPEMGPAWWGSGVTIANAGPGVALDVDARWSGVWDPYSALIDVGEEMPATFLESGARHDIPIAPGRDLLLQWSKNPEAPRGMEFTYSTDVGVGTLSIRYTDIYGQVGWTSCRVAMKAHHKRGEVVCKEIRIDVPGEERKPRRAIRPDPS